jgi:hypothetical protein
LHARVARVGRSADPGDAARRLLHPDLSARLRAGRRGARTDPARRHSGAGPDRPSQRGEQTAFLPQKVVDQRVVAVYFDKKRRVERLANYGMQDGKIFDFISRTTPTAGQELSYLTYIFKIFSLNK